MKHLIFSFLVLVNIYKCINIDNSNYKSNRKMTEENNKSFDLHSYSVESKAHTTHLYLNLNVDFENKKVSGIASHTISNQSEDKIIFDIKGLKIIKIISNDNPNGNQYKITENDKILGQKLSVNITNNTHKIDIYYETTAESEALQWLTPQQTAYKKYPFLFTQGEAILTRSWIPIQDSPSRKITYSAKVTVPDSLTAVMSANSLSNVGNSYEFNLDKPIPCYLIALAVGKIEYKSLGKRTGVWAEPNMLDSCYKEFEEVEEMIKVAEKLYGEYVWGKYDIIVLPPSFPFGGMENPLLTFATPSIIVGDKSLTSLIAHELAHSWSGNLVTNSTWNDFWLNEGFTVYFERRINEALYGREYSEMLATLGYQDMMRTIKELKNSNNFQDTRLKLDLNNRNPDDGMTDIAYEKGYFFLRMIEENVGRDEFDKFLKNYFSDFKYKNLNTIEFENYLYANLPSSKELNIKDWLYMEDIESNVPKVYSKKFENIDKIWKDTSYYINKNILDKWTTHEWLNFIRKIDSSWTVKEFEQFDKVYNLTNSNNPEIACAWFEKSINANYKIINTKLTHFLVNFGRRKFLIPLYDALIKNDQKSLALQIYSKARQNYHFVATNTIDNMLKYNSTVVN